MISDKWIPLAPVRCVNISYAYIYSMRVPIFLFLFCANAVLGQPLEKTVVFRSGEEGYAIFRIPAIVRHTDGSLLAFCEGRRNGGADFGDIDIVMKRSSDQGRSWGPLQVVASAGQLQAGNPAPVVDQLDPRFPSGRIFLFYNTGNNHEGEVRKKKGLREVWYTTSVDGGANWTEPVNITLQVHRPNDTAANPLYRFSEDWRSYANAPGHATQFTSGPRKGRIYVPANHSAGPPQPRFLDYKAHGYYTDDHGLQFQLSEVVERPGSNEATAAFLGDNRLMLNMRNQSGSPRQRIIAISNDGGDQWDTVYNDPHLPDPVCQGSLLELSIRKRRQRLAFSNAADTLERNKLTVRISRDGGLSWYKNILVEKGTEGTKKDIAAYSDLVKLGRRTLGLLYERNDYREIVFTSLHW